MLSRKLGIVAASILTIIFLCASYIAFNLIQQVGISVQNQNAIIKLHKMSALQDTARKIQFDIVQTQQFLQDYSATRGYDGLDDGPEEAAKFAADFKVQVANAKLLAEQLNLVDIKNDLDDMEKAFPEYYAAGQKMSQTYANEGTKAGNSLMASFDAAASRLLGVQDKAINMIVLEADKIDKETLLAAKSSRDKLSSTLWLTIAVMIFICIAFVSFSYVIYRSVIIPIGKITDYLNDSSDAHDGSNVPEFARKDEIGAISKALARNEEASKAWELEKRNQEDRYAIERKRAVDEMATKFELSVGGIIGNVSSATFELNNTVQSINETIQKTTVKSNAVSLAAEQSGASLASVASAAEELSSSASEIARQVVTSSEITRAAVIEANRASQVVAELDVVAASVSGVVDVISNLASQTNLLALNATIESARAGEAGKGFAVVAAEVKELANSTTKATADISLKIEQIQAVSRDAVNVLRGISSSIEQVDVSSSAIVTTIEQQSAATREIIVSMNHASNGASEVTANIADVTSATEQTGVAVEQLSISTNGLAEQATLLNKEMQTFVDNIRMA